YAKNTKEASTYVMPAYILVIGVGMVAMFGEASTDVVPYAIPFYNCSITLKSLLTGDLTAMQFAVSAISTFVAGGVITVLIGKLFNSEKVMFNA
ncbi:MAG: ABC transporter permease, partial [Lachnospiraceae bacterium]